MQTEILDDPVIDAKELNLDEWLNLLNNPPERGLFIDYSFPTDAHKEEYLDMIDQRSEDEVLNLIRHFLIPSSTLRVDDSLLQWIKEGHATPALFKREYTKRLLLWHYSKEKTPPPWEGITWVLDLLPDRPSEAVKALGAYILAHILQLPDGRYHGLTDAGELIRARFIGVPRSIRETLRVLLKISPREFECLTEQLYTALGYKTELTPPSGDGGYDIAAVVNQPTRSEKVLIQCKRYEANVGVPHLRELLGVVSSEKATKGVLVTNSDFTKPAYKMANRNPRIELITGKTLVTLMNDNLGPRWPNRIERLVAESEKVASR